MSMHNKQRYSNEEQAQNLYDLFQDKLPFDFLKIGFPLHSVFEPCLVSTATKCIEENEKTGKNQQTLSKIQQTLTKSQPTLIKSQANLNSSRRRVIKDVNISCTQAEVTNCLNSQNLGVLQLNEVLQNQGLPYTIIDCEQVSKEKPNQKQKTSSLDFQLTLLQNEQYFEDNNVELGRTAILQHECVLSHEMWENLLHSFCKLKLPNFSVDDINEQGQQNKERSTNELKRQSLLQCLLYPQSEIEPFLEKLAENQSAPDTQTFIYYLKQARKQIFDIWNNKVYVNSIVSTVLTCCRDISLHFSYTYCTFLGVHLRNDSNHDSSHNSSHSEYLCPIQQCLLTDKTYSIQSWLQSLPAHSLSPKELLSILFQICFTLCYSQKSVQFIHNDLSTENIGLISQKNKTIENKTIERVYKWKNKYYVVPTYGKLVKIQNFRDSSCNIGKQTVSGNQHSSLDLELNTSVDLIRLGATLIPFLKSKLNKNVDPKVYDKLLLMVCSWTTVAYPLYNIQGIHNSNELAKCASTKHLHNSFQDIQHSISAIENKQWQNSIQNLKETRHNSKDKQDKHYSKDKQAEHKTNFNSFALPENQTAFFDCFVQDNEKANRQERTESVIEMYRDQDFMYNLDLNSHTEEKRHRLNVVKALEQYINF